MDITEAAEKIATKAHRGQVDKAGLPYIHHPRAVAEMLKEESSEVRATAWLHDVVEDTPWTLTNLVCNGIPPEVAEAVEALTRQEGETYFDYVRRAAANPIARKVKRADNAHNSSEERLALLEPKQAKNLRKRYEKARKILND